MQRTIAVAILAGGLGRRLGGKDKALVEVAGRPLLTHLLERLQPQAAHVVLSANGDAARFAAFGLPVVADIIADAGPLAGIAAVASHCAAEWPEVRSIVTIPVDVPFPPNRLIAAFAEAPPDTIAVAEADGRMQWAIARWPLPLAQRLAAAIRDEGVRRVEAAVRAAGFVAVPFHDPEAFANINTSQDLERAHRRLTSS